ncbi:signal peptidase I [Candidatus Geothermarchaeota archaeon]|nr:MAG: signal peptidase I [Candidatus Geothermarchaeota archaeon]
MKREAILLTAVLTIFLVRFLGSPLFIAIVASNSMNPTLRMGDLIIAYKDEPKVGDIVVWCYSPLYCIVHRVVEIRDSYIVTKGDANPYPDYPINPSCIVRVVYYTVPREFLSLILLSILFILIYVKRSQVIRLFNSVEKAPIISLSSIVILIILIISLFPISPSTRLGSVVKPRIELSKIEVEGNIILYYKIYGTEFSSIDSVILYSRYGVIQCNSYLLNKSVILVEVPTNFLETINEKGDMETYLKLNASLIYNGTLIGAYPIRFSFHDPSIELLNGSVIIRNPNPIKTPINITIYYAYKEGIEWSIETYRLYLDPGSTMKIDLTSYPYVYVKISYIVNGRLVTYKYEVMRNGSPV